MCIIFFTFIGLGTLCINLMLREKRADIVPGDCDDQNLYVLNKTKPIHALYFHKCDHYLLTATITYRQSIQKPRKSMVSVTSPTWSDGIFTLGITWAFPDNSPWMRYNAAVTSHISITHCGHILNDQVLCNWCCCYWLKCHIKMDYWIYCTCFVASTSTIVNIVWYTADSSLMWPIW